MHWGAELTQAALQRPRQRVARGANDVQVLPCAPAAIPSIVLLHGGRGHSQRSTGAPGDSEAASGRLLSQHVQAEEKGLPWSPYSRHIPGVLIVLRSC